MRHFFVWGICFALALGLALPSVAAQTPVQQAVATPAPSEVPVVTPAPTSSPLDACFKDGLIACLPRVWREYGGRGGAVIVAAFLLVFFILTPLGKVLQDQMQEWLKTLPVFRAKPPSREEIERREDDYLQNLAQPASLESADEQLARFDAYLAGLREKENPLKPSEEKQFVPLAGGLHPEISPRIGLARGGQTGERFSLWDWLKFRLPGRTQPVEIGKMFTEVETFRDIADAMNAVDERTRAPYPVFALLGEPGAGKTTLLRKLMRDQVQRRTADPAAHLPLYVALGAHKTGSPLTFLRAEWKRMVGVDGLDEALAGGRVWLFADGLNEMPRSNFDARLAQWRAFLSEHFNPNGNRAVVTCRLADYGEGIGAPRLVIHKMEEGQIVDFLQKRIPDRAAALWVELERDRDEAKGKIYELAQTPFWLVMLARLSESTGLPRNRADLLEKFINHWLDYEVKRGRSLNSEQREAFWEGLTRLAWEGLRRSQNYTFPRKEALRTLAAGQKTLHAEDLLQLAQDCSLLACENQSARFQHQLMQEYFAARELARQFAAGKNQRAKWRTPWRRWKFVRSRWDALPEPPQTWWEEAVVLAAGMLAAPQAERLARAVLKDTPPLAARVLLESGAQFSPETERVTKERLLRDLRNPRARLPARLAAGKSLARLGDPRLLQRLGEAKTAHGKTLRWIEPEWVEIPPGEFMMGSSPREMLSLLVLHRFTVGQDELPAHNVFVSGFRMARFPVTVAEYRCFMDAGGYENDAYWREPNALRWRDAPLPFEESYQATYIQMMRENEKAILAQVDALVKRGAWSPQQANAHRQTMRMGDEDLRKQWEANEARKRDREGRVTRPWQWENRDLTLANQPVVGVTWFEACAYAAWLTDALHQHNRLDQSVCLRLPSEAQWEKAARGGGQGLWAWGSRWNAGRANTLEGRVMKPSPVGAYPSGGSRYGVEDLHGNVWEWCYDGYDAGLYRARAGQVVRDPLAPGEGPRRVLRGGSWNYRRNYARCALRDRLVPDNFLNYVGFRLVCSPSTSEL